MSKIQTAKVKYKITTSIKGTCPHCHEHVDIETVEELSDDVPSQEYYEKEQITMGIKEDIEEFMGVPYDEVVKHVVTDKEEYLGKLWEDMIPEEVTKEKLWDYYMSDQYAAYLFWQAAEKQDEPAMPQVLANVLSSTDRGYVSKGKFISTERSILDYGCGKGMIAIGLKTMGFKDITLADIPHRYNRFLKFISDKYGLGFGFIPVENWNEYPLNRKYDLIICNEVLQHVLEPEITLLHLAGNLEQWGYLYLSTDSNDSLLKKNTIIQDVEKWNEKVEGMGLKKVFQDENGVWKVWQKE